MINYSKTVEEQLRDWNRSVPLSVEIARSFRGEGEEGATKEGENQTTDPFEGLDVDTLPEEARNQIAKARVEFANLQTEKAKAATEKAQLEANARGHQSRADKFQTMLQKHNLVEDPNASNAVKKDATVEKLKEMYIAEGMPPEQADAFAKMMAKGLSVLKPDIMQEVGAAVGPHLQNVGVMQVDRVLDQASQSEAYGEQLAIPDIANAAREILANLVTQGQQINNLTLDTAIKMAVGEFTMKGGQQMNNGRKQYPAYQPRTVSGGTRGAAGQGFHAAPIMRGLNNEAPIAQSEDTAKAAAAVFKSMQMGLTLKKK